jgi:ABC-type transport system substrate-binding protein
MTRLFVLATLLTVAGLSIHHNSIAQDAESRRVLRLAESQDPGTLDPHLAGDTISAQHCMLIYEALLEFDPFEHTRLRPCLAAAMPVYDAEKLTYTFKLRDDAFFTDDACFPEGKGRKVVAADFVYSFKRLAALPQFSNYWILEGKIAGLDDFSAKGKTLSGDAWRKHMALDVAGLAAPDERTFVVKLTEPFPQFLYVASMSYVAAVAREACDAYGEAMGKHPVGTGPFVLKEWKAGVSLEYTRNSGYRDVRLNGVPADSPLKAYEGKRLPLSDAITFEITGVGKPLLERCLEGELDRVNLSLDECAQVLAPGSHEQGLHGEISLKEEYVKRGLRLSLSDEPVLDYIAFNMADETIGEKAGKKGKAIRKAFALCIDREKLNREHRAGLAKPADQLIPPDVFGHGSAAMPGQRLDTEAAREILRKAGFRVEKRLTKWRALKDDGQQLTLNVCLRSADKDAQSYANFLGDCGEQVGIKVICELLTFSEFLKKEDEGTGQAYDAGWVLDYPDAQNLLQLLYGPYKAPGINAASFENAEFDKAFTEVARLSDQDAVQAKRKLELIKRMSEIVDEETPWALLDWRRSLKLYREGLKAAPPCTFNYALLRYTVMEQP